VNQVSEDAVGVVDDLAAANSLDVRYEADPTAVMLILGIVEALLGWRSV
jgi:hypothetical protein